MTLAVTAVSGQLGREIALKLIDKVGTENVVGLARTPARARVSVSNPPRRLRQTG